MVAIADAMIDDDDDDFMSIGPSASSSSALYSRLVAQQARAIQMMKRSEERDNKPPRTRSPEPLDEDEDDLMDAAVTALPKVCIPADDHEDEPCCHEHGVVTPVEQGVRSAWGMWISCQSVDAMH